MLGKKEVEVAASSPDFALVATPLEERLCGVRAAEMRIFLQAGRH